MKKLPWIILSTCIFLILWGTWRVTTQNINEVQAHYIRYLENKTQIYENQIEKKFFSAYIALRTIAMLPSMVNQNSKNDKEKYLFLNNIFKNISSISGITGIFIVPKNTQDDFPKIKANPNFSIIGHIKEESAGIHLVTRAETRIPIKAQGWKNFNA